MELGLQWPWYKKIFILALSKHIFCESGLPSKGLKMEIVFKRRLTNELLTTYLPSLLLLLMSYATTFFKPFYFEAAVTVNLSILLVTTTLFIRWKIIISSKNLATFLIISCYLLSVWWVNCLQHHMFVWWIFGWYLDNLCLSLRKD